MSATAKSIQEAGYDRDRLMGLAYRMLGTRADAEDVVQEALARFHEVDRGALDPQRYLFRTVSNLCIDRLRGEKVRRRSYVGPWLPEPWVDERPPTELAEFAQDVSLAFLMLLEHLSPRERIVFVLREAFELAFEEIANLLDVTPATCRQRFARAKARLREAHLRGEEYSKSVCASLEVQRNLLERLTAALAKQDATGVMALLDERAVLLSDGGGQVPAARIPVAGVERIANVLVHLAKLAQAIDVRFVTVNGGWGLAIYERGALHTCMTLDVVGDRIVQIFAVRNPRKLARVPAMGS